MIKQRRRNFFSFLFVPHYDELSLFTMSYIFILLVLVNNPPGTWNFSNISITVFHPGLILILSAFLGGLVLCIYHAFSQRKKTSFEKKIMMFFAAIINGFTGIWGGTYILVHSNEWTLSVFPIWNIISGYILIGLLRTSNIEEECIADENVTIGQILLSSTIVTGIFYVCHYVFVLNWAMTFSISVAWATNLSSPVNSLVFRERLKTTQI